MKKLLLSSLLCGAVMLSLSSCLTSALLATTAAATTAAVGTTTAIAGGAVAATGAVGSAAAALPTGAVESGVSAVKKGETWVKDEIRTEAPQGLSGYTIHLNIQQETLCAAANAPAGSVPAEYYFRNGNLSDPNGGRTLSYARTDYDTAVLSLSGNPAVVMVIDFTSSGGGKLTIRQAAADGSVHLHEGAFYLTR